MTAKLSSSATRSRIDRWAVGGVNEKGCAARMGDHSAIARQLCAFAPGAAPSLSALMPRGATKAPETEMSDRALLLQDARRRMQEREKKSVDRDRVHLSTSISVSTPCYCCYLRGNPRLALTPVRSARSLGPSLCGSWSD